MAAAVSTGRDEALTVLFAEDDADTREMYLAYFGGCGLVAEMARDGREAVARAVEILPDVIVVDITLPDIDGFEVCRAVKRNPRTSSIPIIAATGYCAKGALKEARLAGFASFLLKPYAPQRLLAEIHRLARASSRRSSSACPL